MKTVRLFHWNATEAKKRLKKLRASGYDVVYETMSPAVLRAVKKKPPAAILIDLGRLPSQGRDIGIYVRHYKVTRNVPIVFVGGKPGKIIEVKRHLPDAVYTDWADIKEALREAIACPPRKPLATKSTLAGYSCAPLVKKLGIKPNSVITLVNAPRNFGKTLKDMPEGVILQKRLSKKNNLIIWFVKSQKILKSSIRRMITLVGKGGLWIVWPKKSSGMASDLTQRSVREVGLAAGLVDYKICAIDQTWSGLKFAHRKGK